MFRDRDHGRASVYSGYQGNWRAALLLAVLGAVAIGLPPRAGAEADMPTLLLLPFVVHSSEDPEYVRGGLADMLSARFARIGILNLMRENDPAKGTSQLEEALSTAEGTGADYVLFGSFTRFGQGASLDVQCAPTSTGPGQAQEPLREIFVHSGSIGDIIPDLDELAGKVSRFARGEVIEGPPSQAASLGGGGGGVGAPELRNLTRRVEELEALVDDLRAVDIQDFPEEP
jgi:TolB-like protein